MERMGRRLPYKLDPTPLGEGGYARVYQGIHRETGELAAVKKIRPGDDTGKARFEREVEVQALLDHPNVMPIIEHGAGWYAMPLAERSLTKAVEDEQGIDGYQLPTIMSQAGRGLQYAHRQKYVHRDINPNNILEIVEDGRSRWVVADWGLVRKPPGQSSPRLTRRDRPLGTRGYVAPEAIKNPHGADEACDVFSLGTVAHFALTNVWPHEGFPLPGAGWLWEEFVKKCTAQEREKRIKTMSGSLGLISRITDQIRQMENQAQELACPRCGAPMTGARCERCGRVWD
jgi:serine/threonine protein kinase